MRTLRNLFVYIGLLLISGLCSNWLVTHPEHYPDLPDAWWAWLFEVYHVESQEDVADVEFLVPFVGIYFGLGGIYTALRMLKRRV